MPVVQDKEPESCWTVFNSAQLSVFQCLNCCTLYACAHMQRDLGKDLLSQSINKLHFFVEEIKEEGVRENLSKKYLEMGLSSTPGKKIHALEISADCLIQSTPGGRRRNEEVSLWLPASLVVIAST